MNVDMYVQLFNLKFFVLVYILLNGGRITLNQYLKEDVLITTQTVEVKHFLAAYDFFSRVLYNR